MKKEEAIKASLNLTGNFLTMATAATLKDDLGFKHVAVEEPYDYQFFGPPTEGSLDILALKSVGKHPDHFWLVLVIECKKANPDHKTWIFQRDFQQQRDKLFNCYYSNPLTLYRKDILASRSLLYKESPLCSHGYEFNELNGALNRNQENKIFSAAKQANDGLNGFVLSAYNGLSLNPIGRVCSVFKENIEFMAKSPMVVIPIVVTTANLALMDYDHTDVQLDKGEINSSKLILEEVSWVNYAFPLMPSIQVTARDIASGELMVTPNRRSTFVVNSLKLNDFINWIERDTGSYLVGL